MAYTVQEWTLSGLAIELRMDRRTLGKYLTGVAPCREDKKTKFYRMADVVRAIVQTKSGVGDPTAEKARLDKLRADDQEMKNKIARSEYAPVALLENVLADVAGQIRSTLSALPKRIKNSLPMLRAREIDLLKRELTKAQNAIADIEPGFG